MKNIFKWAFFAILIYAAYVIILKPAPTQGNTDLGNRVGSAIESVTQGNVGLNIPNTSGSSVTWGSDVDLRNYPAPFDGFGYAKKAIDFGYATTTLEQDFNTLMRIRGKQNPDQEDLDRSNSIHAKWAVIIGYPYVGPGTIVVPNSLYGANDVSINFGGHAGDYRAAEFCQQVRYFWSERPGAINNASAVENSCREANRVALKDMVDQLNTQGWSPDAIEFQVGRFTTPACEGAWETSGPSNDMTSCILPGPIFR